MTKRLPYLFEVSLLRQAVPNFDVYPFNIPSIRELRTLKLHPQVTYFVGENGSGKSTLLEAMAIAARFNPEGGTKNLRFATRPTESSLNEYIRLSMSARRARTGFFLRAESLFNLATQTENLGLVDLYGGVPLLDVSHGESLLALVTHRFGPDGLYFMDEPEAALSIHGCLVLLRRIHDLAAIGSQFIVATHSPVILAYPHAWIYELSDDGIRRVEYNEVEGVQLMRSFVESPARFLKYLLDDDGGGIAERESH